MTDPRLEQLAHDDRAGIHGGDEWSMGWLLADYLACVIAAGEAFDDSVFDADGVAGTVSALALRAGWLDRDDVDWTVLTHPGSVVWSALLPVAAREGCEGAAIARAASLGYRATASIAELLGGEHRSQWHATATAGGFGAAAAVGAVVGLTPDQQDQAFAHAAAGTGGLGQAAAERQGAAAYNRAVAAATGLQAVRAAQVGAVPIDRPLAGRRGLFALTGASGDALREAELRLVDGVAQASPRVFPVSGFGQCAVLATAGLRDRLDGDLENLVVEVAAPVLLLMDGTAGSPWWSLVDAVKGAWLSGDPFRLATDEEPADLDGRVVVVSADMPVGAARVKAVTTGGAGSEELEPGQLGISADAAPLMMRKWSTMLAAAGRSDDVISMADDILTNGVSADHLKLLRA